MHRITIKEVIDKLKECTDPEIGINIVDLGLIYGVQIDENNNIKLKMTMTSPNVPRNKYNPSRCTVKAREYTGYWQNRNRAGMGTALEPRYDKPRD